MFTVRLSKQRPAPVQRASRLGRWVAQMLCVLTVPALMLLADTLFLHHSVWHRLVEGEPAAMHAIEDHAGLILHR